MTIHRSLVNIYKALGYAQDPKGICYGFSMRWLEASLLNETTFLYERVKLILDLNEKLPLLIQQLKDKKGKDLTSQDKELLAVAAFFDSINLYHSPDKHDSFFTSKNLVRQRHIDVISAIAASDKIQQLGGLTSSYSESLIGEDEQMGAYFHQLALYLEESSNSQNVFAFRLSSTNHAIALTYIRGKGWEFMDINQYPPKQFPLSQTKELASFIRKGFKNTNSYSAFNLSFITTNNSTSKSELKPLVEKLEQFKKDNAQNPLPPNPVLEKNDFIYLVVSEGHYYLIPHLIEHGADLNRLSAAGAPPVVVAYNNGDTATLVALAKGGADLNKACFDGKNLADFALVDDDIEKIKMLMQLGVDFSITPRFIGGDNHLFNENDRLWSRLDIANLVNDKELTQLLKQNQHNLDERTMQLLVANKTVYFELLTQLDAINKHLEHKYAQYPVRYKQAHETVSTLYSNLYQRGTSFFNSPNQITLNQLRAACQLYAPVKKILHTHRGLWNEVHPIIKSILGVLAILTVLPGIIVNFTAVEGLKGAFFSSPKTFSGLALDDFEKNMDAKIKL